jgi:hypothetical protein
MLLYDCGVFLAFVDLLNIEIEYVVIFSMQCRNLYFSFTGKSASFDYISLNIVI